MGVPIPFTGVALTALARFVTQRVTGTQGGDGDATINPALRASIDVGVGGSLHLTIAHFLYKRGAHAVFGFRHLRVGARVWPTSVFIDVDELVVGAGSDAEDTPDAEVASDAPAESGARATPDANVRALASFCVSDRFALLLRLFVQPLLALTSFTFRNTTILLAARPDAKASVACVRLFGSPPSFAFASRDIRKRICASEQILFVDTDSRTAWDAKVSPHSTPFLPFPFLSSLTSRVPVHRASNAPKPHPHLHPFVVCSAL